jgi:hypothetical protein
MTHDIVTEKPTGTSMKVFYIYKLRPGGVREKKFHMSVSHFSKCQFARDKKKLRKGLTRAKAQMSIHVK